MYQQRDIVLHKQQSVSISLVLCVYVSKNELPFCRVVLLTLQMYVQYDYDNKTNKIKFYLYMLHMSTRIVFENNTRT